MRSLTVLLGLTISIPLAALPARISLEGFSNGAVTHRVCEYRHPRFSYAWYPRPFGPEAIGKTTEYQGIVLEHNGLVGLAAHPAGFQPVQGDLPLGAIVRVRGKLVTGHVHPYWTHVVLEASEVKIVHSAASVADQRQRAQKIWQQTLVNNRQNLRCFTTKRNHKLPARPGQIDFMTNWESTKGAFLFSFSETAGIPQSQLMRDFFLVYKPFRAEFESIQGVCSFYEDLC